MMKRGDAMLDLSADAIMGTSKFYATINTKAKPMSYGNLRICYVISGSADWEIDGRIYHVQTGNMILLTHRQKRRSAHAALGRSLRAAQCEGARGRSA